jgi:hypothetical protein
MNIIQWYAISLAGVLAIFFIRQASLYAPSFYYFILFYLSKYFTSPLLIQRRYWTSVTSIQAIALLAYVITNGVCMGIGVRNIKDLMLRSGMLASVNMVPLFLGGRTSSLANGVRIPLHTYYLVHHWVGRVAVIQGLLHASLAISSGNTARKPTISEIMVSLITYGCGMVINWYRSHPPSL